MAKMGRPKKEISKTLFEKLCSIMCTEEEIAGMLECSVDTIERWCKDEYKTTFAEIYKIKSAHGKTSLRRTQFKLAEHNAGMAIFLGKQYLGQKDTVEYEDKEALKRLDAILGGLSDKANSEGDESYEM